MALLSEAERDRVSAAIRSVEQRTDAELVTVLASGSDGYAYIPTLWAALVALLSPWLVLWTPFWLETTELLMLQAGLFATLALLLRWPPLQLRLIPKAVRHWRASNLARRAFLEQNLHHTEGDTGLLIFVSEAEHYVEILADRGIGRHVDDARWQAIVEAFTARVKAGDTLGGFLSCIESCGDILIEHVPHTRDKN